MTSEEVAWVAGLFEGEACFSRFKRKNKDYYQYSILCEMGDLDVLEKLHKIVNCGNVYSRGTRGKTRKETWIFALYKEQEIYNLLVNIVPYMGSRRSKKINLIIKELKEKHNYD